MEIPHIIRDYSYHALLLKQNLIPYRDRSIGDFRWGCEQKNMSFWTIPDGLGARWEGEEKRRVSFCGLPERPHGNRGGGPKAKYEYAILVVRYVGL